MATENITKFIELIKSSPELQGRLNELKDTPKEDAGKRIAALGNELGLPFTAAEFVDSVTVLSDEDLDAVTGGGFFEGFYNSLFSGGKCRFDGFEWVR